MTRGDLVFVVARSLGLDDTVGSDERALLDFWASQGVLDILMKTHAYVELSTATLAAGVSEYELDSDILAIDNGRGGSVSSIGAYEVVSYAELEELQALGAYSGRSKLAIEGNKLFIYPAPATGDYLEFLYVPRPTPMTSDLHDPSDITYGGIPPEWHRAIEFYMLWRGAEYDDNDKKTETSFKNYERELHDIRKEKLKRRSRSTIRARVGYPPVVGTSRRNDIYP